MVIQSQLAPSQITGTRSMRAGNAGGAESLSNLEFQKLLEELTLRINADNQAHEPVPGLDVFMDRPARSAPMRAYRAAPPPERPRGVSTNLTAAIISLAMAVGTGWLYLGL